MSNQNMNSEKSPSNKSMSNKSGKAKLLRWLRELVLLLIVVQIVAVAVDYYRSQSMQFGQVESAFNGVSIAVSPEQKDLALESSGLKEGSGELGQVEQSVLALSYEQPVAVYFWASWCGVCNWVSPSVSAMSEHYPVVAISSTSGTQQRVDAYLQAHDYQFTNVNDPRGARFQALGINLTPTIWIIKDGEVASVTTGFTSPIGLWVRMLLAS